MNDTQPSRREERADCQVGDWVALTAAPEWDTSKFSFYDFHPPGPLFPTVAGPTPHPIPIPITWIFRLGLHFDEAGNKETVWRRES